MLIAFFVACPVDSDTGADGADSGGDTDTDTDTDTANDTGSDTGSDTGAAAGNHLLVDGVYLDLDGYQYYYTAFPPYANLSTYNLDYSREILVQTLNEVRSYECSTATGVSVTYAEMEGSTLIFSSDYAGGSCTIVVTQVDATSFSGTYTAIVNSEDGTVQHVLTEGVFGTL